MTKEDLEKLNIKSPTEMEKLEKRIKDLEKILDQWIQLCFYISAIIQNRPLLFWETMRLDLTKLQKHLPRIVVDQSLQDD